jgi:hypothetical protein
VQRDQLEATPDAAKRSELLWFFDSVSSDITPTAALVWGVSKWDQADWPTDERIEVFTLALERQRLPNRCMRRTLYWQ